MGTDAAVAPKGTQATKGKNGTKTPPLTKTAAPAGARAAGSGGASPATATGGAGALGLLTSVRVDAIDPSPFQTRRVFEATALAELGASMAESGLVQPITVRAVGARYQLIAGERRWRAAQGLGWEVIPAVVRALDDAEAAGAVAVENLQRVDLGPLEEAEAFAGLMQRFAWSQSELARRLGVPRATVGDRVRLLELPPCWLDEIRRGPVLQVSHAPALGAYRAAPPAVHEAALERLRKSYDWRQALEAQRPLAVDVAGSVFWNAYSLDLLDLELYPVEGYTGPVLSIARPWWGEKAARRFAADPVQWMPLREAQQQATAAAREVRETEIRGQMPLGGGTRSSSAPAAGPGRGPRALRADVVLQLPDNHADPVDRHLHLFPRGVAVLTDETGRWDVEGVREFDPDALRLANETICEVCDYVAGARRVGTTDVAALQAAEAAWEARWTAREHELRAAAAALDCTLRGAGVRPLLDWFLEVEDELFSVCVREVATAHGLPVSDDVRDEVGEGAESYPSPAVTGAWLRTWPLAAAEQLASTYLQRERTAGRGSSADSIGRQVRQERADALAEIARRPVPWVIARPPVVSGEQQALFDEAASDDEAPADQAPAVLTPVDDAFDAAALGTCLVCHGEGDDGWAAFAPAEGLGVCAGCATGEEAESLLLDHLDARERAG